MVEWDASLNVRPQCNAGLKTFTKHPRNKSETYESRKYQSCWSRLPKVARILWMVCGRPYQNLKRPQAVILKPWRKTCTTLLRKVTRMLIWSLFTRLTTGKNSSRCCGLFSTKAPKNSCLVPGRLSLDDPLVPCGSSPLARLYLAKNEAPKE